MQLTRVEHIGTQQIFSVFFTHGRLSLTAEPKSCSRHIQRNRRCYPGSNEVQFGP